MRFPAVLAVLTLAAGAVSCSQSNAPREETGAATAQSAPKAAGQSPSQQAQATPIPKGAQWTILCREITGPGHVQAARQLKESLVKSTGMKDWHLLHKDDASVLYYGYYKTYNEPRARADRAKIDAMADAQGRRPFRLATITPLDAADPVGPPEWNLANAKGYWSLQIGAYMGSPERKQYAVDAVRAARQQGIEAYYYHGENMSLVCVGTWPREAVQTADENVRPGDEGQIKVVLPPLTPDVQKTPEIRRDGRKMHVEAGRNVVVDPTLKTAMEDLYPTMATNGVTMMTKRTDPRTGQVQSIPDGSFPVRIPQPGDDSLLGGDGGAVPLPPPDEALAEPPAAPTFRTGVRGGRSVNGS